MAQTRQVLCVTHLAQIATVARSTIFWWSRPTDRQRTSVSVQPLEGHDRVEEIARMLAGVLTESTLDHARELLALAENDQDPPANTDHSREIDSSPRASRAR